jgi:hypothetical protein
MINVTFDPPNWVDINRGKLDRLILLAAYQINESSGALIDKLEARNEGRKPKAKRTKRQAA